MRRSFVLAAGLLVSAAVTLQAQGLRVAPRALLGISGTLGRPVGEFQQFVGWGGGLDGYGLIPLPGSSSMGLRVEGSLLIYGHESYRTPFSSTVRRVTVDVNTDNFIFGLGVGPQLTLGHGRIRPYLFGTAGLSYFATISSVEGTADFDDDGFSSTNFDDFTFALNGGGGLLIGLSRGRHPVSLDLSAVTRYNGEAVYMRRGGIIERADGSLTLETIRSQANLVSFRVGIAIGL